MVSVNVVCARIFGILELAVVLDELLFAGIFCACFIEREHIVAV